MKIIRELCIGCGQCLKFCPMHAISLQDKKAVIDETVCVECGSCARAAKCPRKAIVSNAEELVWPRTMRNILSDPCSLCVDTGVTGRGTEEMKTNDVTHRFNDPNYVGVAIDIGRPNLGVCLRDVDKITRKLAPMGVEFEKQNPVNYLMEDLHTGKIKDEVMDEYLMSLVLEFSIPAKRIPELVEALHEVETTIDTVFSVGIISLVGEDNRIPAMEILEENNIPHRRSGKTNIGIGHM